MKRFSRRGLLKRRSLAIVLLAVTACTPLAFALAPASAFTPTVTFNFNVDATTHLKKLNQDIVVKGGTFKGGIDFSTATDEKPNALLIGQITLPTTTFTYSAAGILPLITATAKIVPTKPVTGYVNLSTLTVTATATFNIRIISAKAAGTDTNLVGDYCRTSQPISVTMSGPASFAGASVFSGEFTIPNLIYCGAVQTTALNLVLPGPGNTFTASATPK